MINKTFFVILLSAIVSITNAQNLAKNGTPETNKFGFSAGYFGYNFSNAGIQLGVEKYLATTTNYNIIGGINMLYYNQQDIQSAIAINARIGQRYTAGSGLFLETYLGLGVQQTFYSSKTFDYDAGEATTTETKMSKTGVSPNIALGLGYDFSKKLKYPVKFYLRPSFSWLYPDRNLVFQSSYAIETGVIYVPSFNRK